MRNLWHRWLAGASVLTAAYFIGPNSPESKLVLFNGVGFLAVILILVGARTNNVTNKEPWLWLAAGVGSFVAGDVLYYILQRSAGPQGPAFPSMVDMFYLAMYPLIMVGLLQMGRGSQRRRRAWVELILVGAAVFALMWVWYVRTTVGANSSGLSLVVQVAYPAMDAMLLAVALRMMWTVQVKDLRFVLLLGGLGSLAIADVAYNIYLNNGTFQTGLFIDFFWLAFPVLLAAAALYPLSARSDEPRAFSPQPAAADDQRAPGRLVGSA